MGDRGDSTYQSTRKLFVSGLRQQTLPEHSLDGKSRIIDTEYMTEYRTGPRQRAKYVCSSLRRSLRSSPVRLNLFYVYDLFSLFSLLRLLCLCAMHYVWVELSICDLLVRLPCCIWVNSCRTKHCHLTKKCTYTGASPQQIKSF